MLIKNFVNQTEPYILIFFINLIETFKRVFTPFKSGYCVIFPHHFRSYRPIND